MGIEEILKKHDKEMKEIRRKGEEVKKIFRKSLNDYFKTKKTKSEKRN